MECGYQPGGRGVIVEMQEIAKLPFQLQAIYIRDSATKIAPDFNPTVAGQALAGEFRMMPAPTPIVCTVSSAGGKTSKTLCFTTKFEFRYRKVDVATGAPGPATNDDDSCAQVSVDIVVEYLLSTNEVPAREFLERWAQTAVLTQAWPYWREYCHNMMQRMHLPTVMVPFLQLDHLPAPSVGTSRKKARTKTG